MATQSSSFPPGTPKPHYSISKGALAHQLARSLTPAKGNKGEGNTFPEEGASSVQPTCKGAIPSPEWESGASDLPLHCGRDRGPRHTGTLPGKHRHKTSNAPPIRGGHAAPRPAAGTKPLGWEKALACLQAGLGTGRAPFPPVRCGDRGSHPAYRVAPLSRQPKERNGKRPMTANTKPCLQGWLPSAKTAAAPRRRPGRARNVLCPESLSRPLFSSKLPPLPAPS